MERYAVVGNLGGRPRPEHASPLRGTTLMTAKTQPNPPTPRHPAPTLTGERARDRAEQSVSAPVFTRTNMVGARLLIGLGVYWGIGAPHPPGGP